MVYKTCGDTIAVRLEKGEEIVSSIRAICEKEGVKAGTNQGLGAADHSVVGINDSTKDGELYLHIHATLGDDKGLAHGGHLNEAVVSATCELFIRKLDMVIERKADPKTGINLMVF